MNAYVFEKNLTKKVSGNITSTSGSTNLTLNGKKIISVGDYELGKFDLSAGMNYGFFASGLEDERKEVKLGVLSLIKKIGKKYKEFSIKSFKYIIELLNDEEDEVRYETIECMEVLLTNFKYVEVK